GRARLGRRLPLRGPALKLEGAPMKKQLLLGSFIFVGLIIHALIVRAIPNGQTKDALSFAGKLAQNGQPLAGQQTITFAFKKNANSVCSPSVTVTADSNGAFTTQVPIDKCPGNLFDGGDVVVDLSVGNNVVAQN